MSLRLLVMGARADHRLLVRMHVEIEWPDVTVVEHRLGEDPPLEAQFTATGFDAVVIVAAPPTAAAAQLALDLAARPEFAPVVLILLQDAPRPGADAVPGLVRLAGRKIDRLSLLNALKDAARTHRRALARMRARPDYAQRYRFGNVVIRGHRCIKQVGTGGMCTIYLAESERTGNIVVLKVFSQDPDISERHITFDRFLQ